VHADLAVPGWPGALTEERINLWFELDSERRRANSLHKLDTLITALRVFRTGLEEEFAEYDRREKELKELKGE